MELPLFFECTTTQFTQAIVRFRGRVDRDGILVPVSKIVRGLIRDNEIEFFAPRFTSPMHCKVDVSLDGVHFCEDALSYYCHYAPVITRITPNYGPTSGSTLIEIHGNHFVETEGYCVCFLAVKSYEDEFRSSGRIYEKADLNKRRKTIVRAVRESNELLTCVAPKFPARFRDCQIMYVFVLSSLLSDHHPHRLTRQPCKIQHFS